MLAILLYEANINRYYSDAYEAILTWLGAIGAKSILTDLQSHRELGNVTKCEGGISQPPQTQFYIPAKELASAMKRFEASKQTEHTSLGQCLAMSVRRSPKRRSVSEETEKIPKRRRISIASSADERSVSNSWVNGPSTPSPTNSTISLPASETPLVTVAMLRALTKNMKQRYTKS
ncbi:hypothetical protein BD779DRAFT_1749154 [Infundibulicybe gibba]|nr:hypothetical protein BD779DRAFT_1749154 [Infundibulicybe gibba]